jgi:phage terminase large subunit
MTICAACKDKGLYYYLLPTFTQAKKIIWDGITNDGLKFLDCIPEALVKHKNGQEMKIELINGSIIQLIGTDNYDSIRGTNPRGCVFSEYAFQNPMAWEVVKPILKVNKGWVVFNTTPNGKNHAYDLFNMAEGSSDWFSEKLSIKDTGVLTQQDMEEESREGMSDEMIAQEYYCDFSVGTMGAYYASLMTEAEEAGRISTVPVEPNLPVHTILDLGRNDSTSIIFAQWIGKEIRIIDFFEHNGESVSFYCKELDKRNYRYGKMYLPHDAEAKRMESQKTIQQQFQEAGFRTEIVDKLEIKDGIQQARKLFPRIWFDKTNTAPLIKALENYHKNWDEVKKVFQDHPCHDWSSHAADSFRYLAVAYNEPVTFQEVRGTSFDKFDL